MLVGVKQPVMRRQERLRSESSFFHDKIFLTLGRHFPLLSSMKRGLSVLVAMIFALMLTMTCL